VGKGSGTGYRFDSRSGGSRCEVGISYVSRAGRRAKCQPRTGGHPQRAGEESGTRAGPVEQVNVGGFEVSGGTEAQMRTFYTELYTRYCNSNSSRRRRPGTGLRRFASLVPGQRAQLRQLLRLGGYPRSSQLWRSSIQRVRLRSWHSRSNNQRENKRRECDLDRTRRRHPSDGRRFPSRPKSPGFALRLGAHSI